VADSERSCRHCGRAVGETTHGRATYAVDAFALHTGETEDAVFRRADGDEVPYRRLVRPVLLLTCADCYADAARRGRHETWTFPLD
jgi:hypothetical protein